MKSVETTALSRFRLRFKDGLMVNEMVSFLFNENKLLIELFT